MLSELIDNPYNPRHFYTEQIVHDTSESISEKGQLVPLTVAPKGSGFIVIDGHVRKKALERCGKLRAKCVLFSNEELTDAELYSLARVANVQRNDQSIFDDSVSFKKLLASGVAETHEAISQMIKAKRSYVTKALQLNEFPNKIMYELVSNWHSGVIGLSVAYSLLQVYRALNNEEHFLEFLAEANSKKFSRSKIEAYLKQLKTSRKKVEHNNIPQKVSSLVSENGQSLGKLKQTSSKIELKFDAKDEDLANKLVEHLNEFLSKNGVENKA